MKMREILQMQLRERRYPSREIRTLVYPTSVFLLFSAWRCFGSLIWLTVCNLSIEIFRIRFLILIVVLRIFSMFSFSPE